MSGMTRAAAMVAAIEALEILAEEGGRGYDTQDEMWDAIEFFKSQPGVSALQKKLDKIVKDQISYKLTTDDALEKRRLLMRGKS